MQQFKTKQFLELQKKWYAKLKDSGFKDIEQGDKLLRHDGDWFHKHIVTLKYRSTQEFYTQCEQYLSKFKSKGKQHKRIWQLFSEGKTLDEIAERVEYKRSQIHNIITQYIKVMEDERNNTKEEFDPFTGC